MAWAPGPSPSTSTSSSPSPFRVRGSVPPSAPLLEWGLPFLAWLGPADGFLIPVVRRWGLRRRPCRLLPRPGLSPRPLPWDADGGGKGKVRSLSLPGLFLFLFLALLGILYWYIQNLLYCVNRLYEGWWVFCRRIILPCVSNPVIILRHHPVINNVELHF